MDITLTGTILEGTFSSVRFYPGSVFPYRVHIPAKADTPERTALLVTHDGLHTVDAWAMEQLAETGEAPCCITVGISPATLPATLSGGYDRGMRMQNYDIFSPVYPNFVVEELLPYLTGTHGLAFSTAPDMHMTSGGSSGGISAWNMAWYRTDFFRRVYMSSPSFLAMGCGNELPHRIRKTETKPIRVFTDFSENEPNDYFGSSYSVAWDAEKALRFAGYDVESAYYPGEGHCSRNGSPEDALKRMHFLWKNWEKEPITVKGYSPRVAKLISPDALWEETNAFPDTVYPNGIPAPEGTYTSAGDRILYHTNGTTRTAAEGFGQITALALSADKWRLYVSDSTRGCVYALTILPDGTLSAPYLHAALHLETDFRTPGAVDLCVGSDDRVYAATECGIQSIRSFGLIDAIIPLPDNQMPEKIEFGTDGYLYAAAGERIYRRKWLAGGRCDADITETPQFVSYYD